MQQFIFKKHSKFKFPIFCQCESKNHVRSWVNSIVTHKIVMFYWNQGVFESNVCYLSTVYPSILYQTAIWPVDWTQGHVIGWCEKNGGRQGQCLWGKVRGYGPLTTHVKAWLTHPASFE